MALNLISSTGLTFDVLPDVALVLLSVGSVGHLCSCIIEIAAVAFSQLLHFLNLLLLLDLAIVRLALRDTLLSIIQLGNIEHGCLAHR